MAGDSFAPHNAARNSSDVVIEAGLAGNSANVVDDVVEGVVGGVLEVSRVDDVLEVAGDAAGMVGNAPEVVEDAAGLVGNALEVAGDTLGLAGNALEVVGNALGLAGDTLGLVEDTLGLAGNAVGLVEDTLGPVGGVPGVVGGVAGCSPACSRVSPPNAALSEDLLGVSTGLPKRSSAGESTTAADSNSAQDVRGLREGSPSPLSNSVRKVTFSSDGSCSNGLSPAG